MAMFGKSEKPKNEKLEKHEKVKIYLECSQYILLGLAAIEAISFRPSCIGLALTSLYLEKTAEKIYRYMLNDEVTANHISTKYTKISRSSDQLTAKGMTFFGKVYNDATRPAPPAEEIRPATVTERIRKAFGY